mgnify:CR=1 FL=1
MSTVLGERDLCPDLARHSGMQVGGVLVEFPPGLGPSLHTDLAPPPFGGVQGFGSVHTVLYCIVTEHTFSARPSGHCALAHRCLTPLTALQHPNNHPNYQTIPLKSLYTPLIAQFIVGA